MAINTTSIMPPAVRDVLNKRFLSIEEPYLIHGAAADKVKMPAQGDTVVFSRLNKLGLATVPLGNTGVTPAGATTQRVDIKARMQYYGNHLVVNEQVPLQADAPILNEYVKVLGVNMRETEDVLIRKVLESASLVLNCTEGVNGNVPTEITRADILKITTLLQRNSARTLMSSVNASDRFGTGPVPNAYIAMGHVNLGNDLASIPKFKRPIEYGSGYPKMEAEYGAVEQVRFLLSALGSKVTNGGGLQNTDLYNNFITGMEAYKCVNQDTYDKQLIYKEPVDPYNQNASLAYKFSFAGRIVNSKWIVNLRSTLLNA